MSFRVEVSPGPGYYAGAAQRIAEALPARGSVVLTGGSTAERIYPLLAQEGADWSRLEGLFSDERCVPPGHPESNYGMATRLLLDAVGPQEVYRMRGEDPPELAALAYHETISKTVESGLDLLLLGMGADAHIGAMFPGSPALGEVERLCRSVDRPDGMQGLTLTPPALLRAKKVLLLVTGETKAATVKRVIHGSETFSECPARLLTEHPDATFLLDEEAASAL